MLLLIKKPHHTSANNFNDTFTELLFFAIHAMVLIIGIED